MRDDVLVWTMDDMLMWADVTGPASAYGLAPLAGSAHDVGVVGYTLGGGLSWLARKYGFACDSVTAIELVTAGGRHVKTDEHNDPELFRALRGGGGNFGVVTAIEFKLYPVESLTAGAMAWPWERAEEIFNAWREWTQTVPDDITSLCRMLQVPNRPDVPAPLRGRQLIVVEAAILGDPDMLAPLRALEPELDMFAALPVDAAFSLFAVGVPADAESAMAIDAALARLMAATAPYDAGRSLLNFTDKPGRAGLFFDGYTLHQLRAVKDRVDSGNLFAANHPIR